MEEDFKDINILDAFPFRMQGTSKNTNEGGFTITELLVVLTVIAAIVLFFLFS